MRTGVSAFSGEFSGLVLRRGCIFTISLLSLGVVQRRLVCWIRHQIAHRAVYKKFEKKEVCRLDELDALGTSFFIVCYFRLLRIANVFIVVF